MLLAEISQFHKSIETKFLYDHWTRHKEAVTRETSSPLVQILSIIGNHATAISHIAIEDIKSEFLAQTQSSSRCQAFLSTQTVLHSGLH